SSSWTTISLASGYSHDGNNNGTCQYRLVNFFGEVSLMFRGGVATTCSSPTGKFETLLGRSSGAAASLSPCNWKPISPFLL
ncbi:hypothetical protein KBZ21_40590, partial [Streptomyces sp. A73]|nr:hypothetical protein [Streptomyces sp. A73]